MGKIGSAPSAAANDQGLRLWKPPLFIKKRGKQFACGRGTKVFRRVGTGNFVRCDRSVSSAAANGQELRLWKPPLFMKKRGKTIRLRHVKRSVFARGSILAANKRGTQDEDFPLGLRSSGFCGAKPRKTAPTPQVLGRKSPCITDGFSECKGQERFVRFFLFPKRQKSRHLLTGGKCFD